jgi:serine/threonine protein kinase
MEAPSIADALKKARESEYSSHFKVGGGDNIGEYVADSALGSGRFATVWSANRSSSKRDGAHDGGCKDGGCNDATGGGCNEYISPLDKVAVKLYRSGRTNQEYWRNEVRILNLIAERAALSGIQPPNIIRYHGTFAVVSIDDLLEPNIHPCIVFGLAGDSVSRLLKHCRREYSAGVPIECARKIIRDTLRGLEFVHSVGLIHTDIKPSNLLLDRAIGDINGLDFNVLIGDFGSSTPVDNLFSRHVGTDLYLAPELLLERAYTSSVDIWAIFTTAFELVTGDPIFDVFHEFEISYGDDVDNEALEGLEHDSSDSVPELIPGPSETSQNCDGEGCDDGCEDCCGMDCGSSCRSNSGSSSGSEDPEQLALVAYRHLLLMEKVLGPPSRSFAKTARMYYNARGKLKNNPAVNHITIAELLSQNYDMSHVDCKALEGFLLNGLKYNPDERITAADALALPWLR